MSEPGDNGAEVFAEMIRAMSHPEGARGRMRDLEIEHGHTVLVRDQPLAFSFSSADWDEDTLITMDGKDVRLILTNALHPGTGALHRLVASIQAAGLNPVVLSPVGPTMPAIMKHWGWKMHTVGAGFHRSEEWRPA